MIDRELLPYLTELRAVTTDANGEQVLVGLTAIETAEYFSTKTGAARFSELVDRHEAARLQVIFAENQLRVEKPTRN